MSAKKMSRLGRGLSSLLGEEVPANIPTPPKVKAHAAAAAAASGQDKPTGPVVQELDISQLKAGKYQPRTLMEQEKLQELSESIRQQGVISPIIVRPTAAGRYEIIAGERRYRASKLAGRKTVPAIVREVDDKSALAMALIENMQREDLNAVEEAMGVSRLIEEFGYTHEQAAEAIGRSRSATTNLLRLLNLTEAVKQMLADGHTVGNHTWSHPDMSKISTQEAFSKELSQVEDLYREITGQEMTRYYRPPQGIYSQPNLQMAKDLGYETFFWSLAYVDWYQDNQPTKEQAFDKLLTRIHPGAIVLLHSTSSTNAQILDELLTRWEEMGYTFKPLSEVVS